MELWQMVLLCLGLLILSTNFIDIPYLISKLVSKSKTRELIEKDENKQEGFLEIVSLWYQLKNKCDEHNLDVASDKLDEVFPLLNKVIEDNNGKVS
jgi:hypothetical protein